MLAKLVEVSRPDTKDDILVTSDTIIKVSHEYGPLDKTLDGLTLFSRGKCLHVLERFYIYKAAKYKHFESVARY
jgi:hypothetical protein